MGVQFSKSARKPDSLFPQGTIVKAKIILAKAFEPLDGRPDYLGLDRDGVTVKINFQFDCYDGTETRTIFSSWAVPAVEQIDPDSCDMQRVNRGERMLFTLACCAQGIDPESPEAETMELRSWDDLGGKKVRIEVGQFKAQNGKSYQTVERFLPLKPRVAQPVQPQRPEPEVYVRGANGWPTPARAPVAPAPTQALPVAPGDDDEDVPF